MKSFLLVCLLAASFGATASDGQIRFAGRVVVPTCPAAAESAQSCLAGQQVVRYSVQKVELATRLTEYHGNLQTLTMTYE